MTKDMSFPYIAIIYIQMYSFYDQLSVFGGYRNKLVLFNSS